MSTEKETKEMMIPTAVMPIVEMVKLRQEFADYCSQLLKEGQDYGKVPGTDKPSLLKPGAEKLLNLYGLTTRMILVEKEERWDPMNPFFKYDYKCQVIWPRKNNATGEMIETVIAECIGSCNSFETKYGWRWAQEAELTPGQKELAEAGKLRVEGRDKDTPLFVLEKENKALHDEVMADVEGKIFKQFVKDSKKIDPKSKKPYSVKWVTLPAVKQYQVLNDKVFDQVNTLQKMAQKRALVGATIIAVKASDMYTQDMEDQAEINQAREAKAEVVNDADKAKSDAAKPAKPATAATSTDRGGLTEEHVEEIKANLRDCETLDHLNEVIKKMKESDRVPAVMEFYHIRRAEIQKGVKA